MPAPLSCFFADPAPLLAAVRTVSLAISARSFALSFALAKKRSRYSPTSLSSIGRWNAQADSDADAKRQRPDQHGMVC